MLSTVRKVDGPCPVAASVTMTAPEDAATVEVAGPITERPSPIGPAEESDQHTLKPIVTLMPKTHLILRMCRIYSLTIQPVRHQVKKPHTRQTETSVPSPLPYDACERILIRMVKQIRLPRHAELSILFVMKPVLVKDRHCQFIAHRLEFLVEEPV
jgi:hypothetical protein